MPQDPPSQTDTPTQIPEDTYCANCEYCLCGLPADGHCPECNTPIKISLVRDHLNDANPKWLHTVRWGITLTLGLYISSWAITLLCYVTGYPLQHSFLVLLLPTLGIVACFLATAADPHPRFDRRWRATRFTARISMIAGEVSSISVPYVAASHITYLLHLTIFTCSVLIVYHCTFLLYIRSLALRGRCTSVATLTVVVLLIQIVVQALVTISSCLVIAYNPSPNSALFNNAVRVQHVGILASYAVSILYLYMLFRYRSLLTKALQNQHSIQAPSSHPTATPPQSPHPTK